MLGSRVPERSNAGVVEWQSQVEEQGGFCLRVLFILAEAADMM